MVTTKKEASSNKDNFVLPGDYLAMEEEFLPDYGSFVDEKSGELRSSSLGNFEKDLEKRSVKVKSYPRVPLLQRRGLKVYGRVEDVSDNIAFIDLLPMESQNFRFVPRDTSAILPVSEAKTTYVETLKNEFKVGDFVKVRLTEVTPTTISVSTKDRDLGVVRAYCSKCRHPMRRIGSRLSCENCGSVETRKLAIDYRKTGGR